jgi:hypothetical protein
MFDLSVKKDKINESTIPKQIKDIKLNGNRY